VTRGSLVISRPRWLLASLVLAALIFAGPVGAGVLDASWTAPTTNTNGSQLTDLASYRVYYGPATAPCPGPAYFQVPSPTTTPGPNTTVSFRLSGLTAGTLYYVAVSAVDLSGNESACSLAANGLAQVDFSVSPNGTVNFGSVNIGSFANQTFTVQNTRGGTVSGTASASAPFSIASGSPFTLAGLGATQTVTVRFTPTTSATVNTNVNFSAVGDAIPRLVTGTGVDLTLPAVTITSPTSNPTYSTSSSPLTLGGTASDNVGVTQVTWANSRGGSGTATGTTSWAASGIVLQTGSNVLTVTARDAAGNTATDTLTVTRTTTSTFTDDPLTARSTLIKRVHFTELRAAIEEFRQCSATVAGVEAVLLLDPNPGEFPSHPGEIVAHAGVLLLEPKQLVTSRLPFLARAYGVFGHGPPRDVEVDGLRRVRVNPRAGRTSNSALPSMGTRRSRMPTRQAGIRRGARRPRRDQPERSPSGPAHIRPRR